MRASRQPRPALTRRVGPPQLFPLLGFFPQPSGGCRRPLAHPCTREVKGRWLCAGVQPAALHGFNAAVNLQPKRWEQAGVIDTCRCKASPWFTMLGTTRSGFLVMQSTGTRWEPGRAAWFGLVATPGRMAQPFAFIIIRLEMPRGPAAPSTLEIPSWKPAHPRSSHGCIEQETLA